MFSIGTVTTIQNGIILNSQLFQCWSFHSLDFHTLDQISVVTWVTQHMIFVFVGAWSVPFIRSREIIMPITTGDKIQLLGTMISHLLLGISILSDTGKFNFVSGLTGISLDCLGHPTNTVRTCPRAIRSSKNNLEKIASISLHFNLRCSYYWRYCCETAHDGISE